MLTTRRKAALVLLPLTLFVLTVAAVIFVSVSYSDASLVWAADAAILTGAALLAALVGLPIGLYQLFAVERDIARLVPVPPRHFAGLRGMLEASKMNLGRQVEMEFGDRGRRQLNRQAFFSHFPDLSDSFVAWDLAVRKVETERAAFADALEQLADEFGIYPEIYDRDAILKALNERTRPSLHLALEEWPAGAVPIKGSVDGSVEVAGIRTHLGVADALTESGLRQLVQPLVDLCVAARGLPQVEQIAQAQDALTAKIELMTDELDIYLAIEGYSMAPSCRICQLNAVE